ncbi:MAG TPA: response regulator [Spirochaetota bacterium]|mgnify:CR=1 FL=1|nr:response regulator [Spirochaetota bacterium]HPI90065.1 response regulator [Spirochaetota bacterium]HPR47852.1 response regulator [Spirochaetota bacterium]
MGKKILIVDDDKDLVQTIAQVLRANQYDIAEAYSGQEALAKLLETKPDLMILDIMMERDTAGFEVVYQIRDKKDSSKYKEVKDVPIIILTAINQVTNNRFSLNQDESFLPSINDFLTKPINIDVMLDKVKGIIQ